MTSKIEAQLLRAWAAGLFEGEGCLTTLKRRGKGSHSRRPPYPTIVVVMTDKDIIEKFHRAIGFGKITGPYWNNNSTKPIWRWLGSGWAAIREAWVQFEPFLGERRRAKFQEILNQDPDLSETEDCLGATRTTYARHLRNREKPCKACRKAQADYLMEWKAKRATSTSA